MAVISANLAEMTFIDRKQFKSANDGYKRGDLFSNFFAIQRVLNHFNFVFLPIFANISSNLYATQAASHEVFV